MTVCHSSRQSLPVAADLEAENDAHVARYYGYLRDVAVMVFVGEEIWGYRDESVPLARP